MVGVVTVTEIYTSLSICIGTYSSKTEMVFIAICQGITISIKYAASTIVRDGKKRKMVGGTIEKSIRNL